MFFDNHKCLAIYAISEKQDLTSNGFSSNFKTSLITSMACMHLGPVHTLSDSEWVPFSQILVQVHIVTLLHSVG